MTGCLVPGAEGWALLQGDVPHPAVLPQPPQERCVPGPAELSYGGTILVNTLIGHDGKGLPRNHASQDQAVP